MAFETELGGDPLTISGYLNQSAAFGISGDHYDTQSGFQSAITQALLEAQYLPSDDVKIFASGKFVADWSYSILSSDSKWEKRGFDDSKDELFMDDNLSEMMHEAHVTWTPGDFFFRVGKQIVVWGETDGFRLMDQINPLDQRRGLTDVEFETTILPVWLAKAEYYFQPADLNWLQDLGVEVIFNPNAYFQPNKSIVPGNGRAGIWAPNIEIPLGGPYPVDFAHLGALNSNITEPGEWDSDGYEYGVRLRAVMFDSIVTLNYFYGIDNDPVTKAVNAPPAMAVSPYDQRFVLHPMEEGYYPRFRFAGLTFTRDLEKLTMSALGGVAPVIRFEGFYGFDNTFTTALETFEKHDEIRWALGVDWKIRVDMLNPRAYFMISPQIYHRKILDYPSYGIKNLEDDNWQSSLMINTTYWHNKIQPSIFWLRDITTNSDMFRMQVIYEHSHKWNYTLGALILTGEDTGLGFEPLENKDQVYFTASYRF